MSIKSKYLLRIVSLLALLAAMIPAGNAGAMSATATTIPPTDMFQLPWDQESAWVAIDGFDNGSKRLPNSPHNYLNGGAIDFAPHNNMIKGEDTSNFWVTAVAAGTIVEISSCHMKIAHADGWVSEYQHLANIQVKLGDVVAQNQRLAVIANALTQPVCPGSEPPDIPHLHFSLRPNMVGATFAGWTFNYNSYWNSTTFTKDGVTVGLYTPLTNAPVVVPTASPTPATTTPEATATPTLPSTETPVPTSITPTPTNPFVSTDVNPSGIGVGETAQASVSLNNVPADGYTSAEFTCSYDANLVSADNIAIGGLFGADAASAINDPQNGVFIVAIAGSHGDRATTSGVAFTFDVHALQGGQTSLLCNARINNGDNVLTSLPAIGASLTIVGNTPTPTYTSTPVFTPTYTPTVSPGNTPTPVVTATPIPIPGDWLTFTNSTYGFQFKYPPEGVIADGATDTYARIDLPFVQGTNLREKYLEVITAENANPCQSPLATQSILKTSETVVLNGITFLKQTGGDAGAGNFYDWEAYSTQQGNVCVSLDFVLHSLDPNNFPTPSPVYDYAAESAVFEQIASTYIWLAQLPTATPTLGTTPVASPTPEFTATPVSSPSPTPLAIGMLTGQVFANKPVTVNLYDMSNTLVTSATVNADGTFSLSAPAGTYNLTATAEGFLPAQGSVTLTTGGIVTKPAITLPAGDIDGNNVIDQLDAMTIGMNYNASAPTAADLNNDGAINILDLELLASNYHQIGPVVWQ